MVKAFNYLITAAKAAVQNGRAYCLLTNKGQHIHTKEMLSSILWLSLSNQEQISLYSDLFTELGRGVVCLLEAPSELGFMES